jgi:hypothetical protein
MGPLRPPSPTGVRTAGDRYQWLVAWNACLAVLRDAATDADNPAVAVGIEVDDAGNLDDVVIRRHRPPHSYSQVKYAVNSSTPVSTSYLTAPSKTGGPSILQKIAGAWRQLAQQGEPVGLSIITNRAPDPSDALIKGRDARTGLLRPAAEAGGPRSARGAARRQWAQAAGVTESELMDLLGILVFELARDRAHLEQFAKLTMLVSGLRGDDAALAAGADWVAEQVVAGRRELDIGAIRQAVSMRNLSTGPAQAVVSIATLSPDPLAAQAIHALDWVDRFDGEDAYAKRRPKPPATWQQLQADIDEIPARINGVPSVAITGTFRQATAFTIGAALRMVTQTDVAVVQRGALWRSDAAYESPVLPAVTEYDLGQGDDIAIGIEIATTLTNDVRSFLREQQVPAGRLVILSPRGGPRDNAVSGPEDAAALAVGIRDTVRQLARGHRRVHLFLAGPMGLALLLGHRWNRVAPTIVYEDLAALGYEAAFTISA